MSPVQIFPVHRTVQRQDDVIQHLLVVELDQVCQGEDPTFLVLDGQGHSALDDKEEELWSHPWNATTFKL